MATVRVTAPDSVAPGDEVTIETEICHRSNDRGHYVDWVRLFMDEELLQSWNCDSPTSSTR